MKNKFLIVTMATMMLVACGKNDSKYDASGVFEATEVTVSTEMTGRLLDLNVEEGVEVTANEQVGLIDTIQLYWQYQQLLAQLSATGRKTLNLEQQTATLRQQIANLEKEKVRFADLLKNGATTQKQVDDIDYQLNVLRKQLAAQEETLRKSNAGVDDQSAAIRAQLGLLDVQLKHCRISSPISGTVLVKYMQEGEFAAAGRPIFKVADINHIFLRAYLTADQVTAIKIGQKVTVFADQGVDERKAYEGRISWISDKAEFTPKTIQTRDERANLVYAVKIAVDNDGLIKSGMYGDVAFE